MSGNLLLQVCWRALLRTSGLMLLTLVLPCVVGAQVLYGSLTGNVTDPTGAATRR